MMDFVLVHGNDWFKNATIKPVGSLCAINHVIVRDVFGVETLIERADAAATDTGELWTMFSIADEKQPDQVAGFFIVPPSPGPAVQVGPTLEDVRFLRDEMANLVWGVEHTIENAVGDPKDAHERAIARASVPPSHPAPGAGITPRLRYVLQRACRRTGFRSYRFSNIP